MELFPQRPEDLGAAEADELRGLLDRLREIGAELRAGTLDVGDLTPEQVKEQLAAAVEMRRAISDELAEREQAEDNYVADVAELTAELGVEDEPAEDDEPTPEPAPDPEGDDGAVAELAAEVEESAEAAEEEPAEETEPAAEATEVIDAEAVAAAAAPRKLRIPRGPRRHQVSARPSNDLAFTAAAGVEGFREAMPLSSRQLAEAVIAKRERAVATARGNSENVVVASLDWSDRYSEERKLYNDLAADTEKIDAVVSDAALTASGGWCAPTVPMYDVLQISSAERPVRDSLPDFNAVRGGVRYTGGLSIADIDDAITVVTSDMDEQGGTFGEKGCQVVECPEISETLLEAISKCLQFGNLASRAWPELVEAFNSAAMAAHAREAETELLDAMAAVSTNVTRAAQYGATSTILAGVLQAAAGMRSRHRLAEAARFRALLPEWLPELLMNDLGNQQFGRFDIYSREGIADLLSRAGVSPVWYKDEVTGSGQIFAAQGAGAAVTAFPTSVRGFVYQEGTFTFLDGGRLDLGIVRDSTLNANNNYQIFAETFEGLIFTGVESLEITWTVCPSGEVAIASDNVITC